METRNIYIVASAILIVLAFSLIAGNFFKNITGNVFSVTNIICNDSDGGLNKYERGIITYSYKGSSHQYTDYCYEEIYTNLINRTIGYKRLSEYYCTTADRVKTVKYLCDKGCVDGACIK